MTKEQRMRECRRIAWKALYGSEPTQSPIIQEWIDFGTEFGRKVRADIGKEAVAMAILDAQDENHG